MIERLSPNVRMSINSSSWLNKWSKTHDGRDGSKYVWLDSQVRAVPLIPSLTNPSLLGGSSLRLSCRISDILTSCMGLDEKQRDSHLPQSGRTLSKIFTYMLNCAMEPAMFLVRLISEAPAKMQPHTSIFINGRYFQQAALEPCFVIISVKSLMK